MALALGPLVLSLGLLGGINQRVTRIDDALFRHRTVRIAQTELMKYVVDADTAVRGYLLTQNPKFLEPFHQAKLEVPELLHRLGDTPSAPARQEDALLHADQQMSLLLNLTEREFSEPALEREKRLMDRFRAEMASLIREEDAAITELVTKRERLQHAGSVTTIVGTLLSLAGVAAGAVLLMRDILKRIHITTENARRVAEGGDLQPVGGRDEIGRMAQALEVTALLLRSRESELRQAKTEADRASAAKSEFISRMSHELRTPLNSILGFAQLIREDIPTALRPDLDQILEAGRHLLSLINEILDIAQIEAGRMTISVEDVALDEVIREAQDLIMPLAISRSIDLDSSVGSGLYARADHQRVKQVVLNLLSNAVKYNRDGGRVWVRCTQPDPSVVRITVGDTGRGIPAAAAQDLFSPFARMGAEASEIEGTGLGLSLSRGLATMMSGDLSLAYTGDAGTEFWLDLPVGASPAAAPTQTDPKLRLVESPGRLEAVTATVLQVEDNAANIRLLERVMRRRPGVDVVTVQRGLEAVETARTLRPSLIFLDVNLPDLSGPEILGRLRGDPATREIPVVMLSADATDGQIERMLAAGARAYLTKPLDIDRLLSLLDEILDEEALA